MIAQVRERKSRFIEDLDECKLICDSRMQGKMNELRTKTQKLEAIKDQVLECRCKQPKDNSVEVKRTPSLAAICRCTSEDKLHGSCSCKSVRTTLLSNLLRDLFEGLQSELNDNGAIMPCELLKCLEDSHNWDRTSPVKTNLRNFFGKLLVGELDIAIASSIEKYHARWIGDSCADRKKSELDQRQQRALENRAQQLAEQLAERLFQERADQIMKKAKKVMKDSQRPCECSNTQPATTYSCILNTNVDKPQKNTKIKNKVYPILKENTVKSIQNQMALQKTKMFKKSTLKPIKEKTNNPTKPVAVRDKKRMVSNQILNHRAVSTDMYEIDSNFLMSRMKKKYVAHDTRFDTLRNSYLSQNVSKNSCLKGFQRDHNYAINLCLFDPHKDQDMGKTSPPDKVETNTSLDGKEIQHRGFNSPRFLEDMPSVELANSVLQPFVLCNENSRDGNTLTCSNNCVCFNKLASNHSLDNILESYREREISYYTELNEKENDIFVTNQDSMRSPYYFDIFDKHCDDENKQKLSAFIRETNKRVNIFKSDYNQNLVDGFDTKGVNCEMPQAPIKNKLSCKDGIINTSFNDINDCRRDQNDLFFQSKQNEGTPFPNRCSKYTNIERNLCDTKTSARSVHVLDNTGSLNVIKNSVVDTSRDPYNFDCRVDFLGVTLHNSNKQNIENKNKSTNKPSKQETSEGVVQIYYDDEKGNEHSKVFKNKFDKRNIETSVTNYYRQNYNTDMHLSNTENKCVCCNKDEEISELEVNTFTLLMEYLQKKMEEYKSSTYKSSNISAFEADLLFNQILEKVKKMILESSKELTCLCFDDNESDGIDACWRRACGLLQEYLRAKIKRLECSCSIEVEKCGSHSLSKVLDKICKMIENDFERLKAISKDTNSLQYNISHSNEKEMSNAKFNGSLFNINEDSNVFSKKNSFKGTQFTNLYDDNLSEKNSKNSKDKQIVPNVEAAQKCYSFYSNKSDVINFAENAQDPYSIINEMNNETVVTSVLTKEKENIDTNRNRNTQSMSVPCVSHNVDCVCNKILGRCTCPNAILLKRNTNLIDANTTPSNIIQHTTDFTKPIAVPYNLLQENEKLCEKEVETIVNEEVVKLKESGCEFQKGANHSTNTNNNLYDNIDFFSYDEWDDCESVPYHDNVDDDASNKAKFYNSLLLPIDAPGNSTETEHIHKTLLSTSDDLVLCSFRSHDCECEMVPICHVKMLMDNIERKLLNYKCTCDSLHPSVCPAHSNTVS